MKTSTIATATVAFAGLAIAKTDCDGCTPFTTVTTARDYTYVTLIYYDPDSLEVCELVDCGGDPLKPAASTTVASKTSLVKIPDVSTATTSTFEDAETASAELSAAKKTPSVAFEINGSTSTAVTTSSSSRTPAGVDKTTASKPTVTPGSAAPAGVAVAFNVVAGIAVGVVLGMV
ncbi:hypothetical protein GMORB2_7227 [Geosmithia morbida]|uniref:Uncharacterized protein n=1 Tax=Geosmithia morbida TaxID=1094350 RepID=A0A9P4YVR1_9HYPO|nr:uncharacterized protein GMORB2_7227 [Geosmithia morbida]KAF4122920.1 hypothetical protein GMORB2_7227 [Geosmithia morbida]